MLERVCGCFQSDPTRILYAVMSDAALLGGPELGPRMRVADGRTPDPLSDERCQPTFKSLSDERWQPRISRSPASRSIAR